VDEYILSKINIDIYTIVIESYIKAHKRNQIYIRSIVFVFHLLID